MRDVYSSVGSRSHSSEDGPGYYLVHQSVFQALGSVGTSLRSPIHPLYHSSTEAEYYDKVRTVIVLYLLDVAARNRFCNARHCRNGTLKKLGLQATLGTSVGAFSEAWRTLSLVC